MLWHNSGADLYTRAHNGKKSTVRFKSLVGINGWKTKRLSQCHVWLIIYVMPRPVHGPLYGPGKALRPGHAKHGHGGSRAESCLGRAF